MTQQCMRTHGLSPTTIARFTFLLFFTRSIHCKKQEERCDQMVLGFSPVRDARIYILLCVENNHEHEQE